MKLAIKGHPTRGKEVIEILEMLGGKNIHNYVGTSNECYAIDDNKICTIYTSVAKIDNCVIFTLEEFEEKFPYKVGDKVSSKYLKNYKIEKMEWGNINNRVIYKLQGMGWYSVDELQPYKEETIKESIDKTNKVIFDTQAQSCDIMNDIIKENMEETNIIKPTTEINLNHPCFDGHNEIELIIPNGWKFEQRGNKMFGIRKQYPKTYEECCKVLNTYCTMPSRHGYKEGLIAKFQELLICRDAYWKIAGVWKPDFLNPTKEIRYFLFCTGTTIENGQGLFPTNKILIFPTEEMRDAFYENFKDLIENCKELL